MPKLIIMNAGTPQMSGAELSEVQKSFAAKTAYRSFWFARAGDIVLTPKHYYPAFLSYALEILALHPSDVTIFRVGTCDESILTDEELLDEALINQLTHIMRGKEWTIDACYATAGVAMLMRRLGILSIAEPFIAQKGTDIFNRKSHFRQFAVGLGLPVANGGVAENFSECEDLLNRLSSETGMLIAKHDTGAGGIGNIILSTLLDAPLPGARETIITPNTKGFGKKLWEMLATSSCSTVVVESYHLASEMFYLEFIIAEDGKTTFIADGAIRLTRDEAENAKELTWIGLEIPSGIPSALLNMAKSYATRLAVFAASLGYRGPLNIDAILTSEGELIFNEINARWGGGSVLHHLGERLLRSSYAKDFTLTSVRNIEVDSFETARDRIESAGLVFAKDGKAGVLILGFDEKELAIECLIISSGEQEAREIEISLPAILRPRTKSQIPNL